MILIASNFFGFSKTSSKKKLADSTKSSYYSGPADRKQGLRKYVEVSDFDVPRLTADMGVRYPAVPKKEIEWIVPFSVFVYHVL